MITDNQIRQLRREAHIAGDESMAIICDIALEADNDNSAEARRVCADVIAYAQAEASR